MSSVRPVPSRQRWLVPLLVAVLAVTVSGGLLAREWYAVRSGSAGTAGDAGAPTPEPGSGQPDPTHVQLSSAARAHPLANEIRTLFQRYFDAINERDYRKWTSTVDAGWVRDKPRQDWLRSYRSTRDSDMRVYRIEALPGPRVRVLVAFTSTQDPADAPEALPVSCIRWHLALPATPVSGGWKLEQAPAGSTPEFSEC